MHSITREFQTPKPLGDLTVCLNNSLFFHYEVETSKNLQKYHLPKQNKILNVLIYLRAFDTSFPQVTFLPPSLFSFLMRGPSIVKLKSIRNGMVFQSLSSKNFATVLLGHKQQYVPLLQSSLN